MLNTIKKVCCIGLSAVTLTLGLSVSANAQTDKETEIHIVHTNDMHGYYKATSRGQIGFSALKKIIDNESADLVLDVGDTFHGQSFATVEEGKSIAELMDYVGYDVMTPGNHDWSYGASRVKQLDEESNFTVLAANVVDENNNSYFDNTYYTKTVTADDGTLLKVGIVGVIDDYFYTTTASKNLKNVKFNEEAEVTNEVASYLKNAEKCDIVLAITHQADCEGYVSAISGVDAVLAGHEHLVFDKTYADKDGKQVRVVEAGNYFQNVGVLSLTYDAEKGVTDVEEKLYSAADTQELADEVTSAKITEIEEREQSVLTEVIGTSSKAYDYSWEEIRCSEQEIGRIVTAAYLEYTGADVVMENSGAIRSGIPEGDITYSDIISISPYGNVLIEKKLTGKQIVDILEYSLDLNRQNSEVYELQKQAIEKGEDPYQYSFINNSGSALQFGGISAEYDLSKPYGERARNIKIGGKAVDLNKIYNVVTNDFVASSSEFPEIADVTIEKEYTTCEQALCSFFATGDFEAAALKANIVDSPAVEEPTTTEPTTQATTPTAVPDATSATGTTVPKETTVLTETETHPATSDSIDKRSPMTGDTRSNMTVLMILIASGLVLWVAYRKVEKQKKN